MATADDIIEAKRIANARATAQAAAKKPTLADSLSELQKSIQASKDVSQAKSVQIPTIALETAVNTGDKAAIVDAAKAVAKAQGGSATTQAANAIAAVQGATPQPTLSPANIARGDTVKWVGGVNGSWQIIKGPGSSTVTSTVLTDNNKKDDDKTDDDKTDDSSKSTRVLIETRVDPKTGDVIGFFSDGSTQVLMKGAGPEADKEYIDAYALLESVFKEYGLEELVPNIKRYMEQGLGSKQAAIELKETQAYKTRFAGNEMRRAAGKNVLDEATYLALENAYDEILRSYGLQNYFGVDRKQRNAKMSEFIGNDINAPEFKDRIDLAVTRVERADPFVKSTLVGFFNITNNDLVNYFLNPKEALPILEEKVRTAEIGGVAASFGLRADLTTALGLENIGVTQARAREGYATIAQNLPRGTDLSKFYKEEGINYTQGLAEEAEFKGTASAKRAEERLRAREISSFIGGAGTGRTSFGSGAAGLI